MPKFLRKGLAIAGLTLASLLHPFEANPETITETASGTVKNYASKPVPNAFVQITNPEEENFAGFTDKNGSFKIPIHFTDVEQDNTRVNYPTSKAKLKIYNALGQEVRTLTINPSEEMHTWDGKDNSGIPVANNIYFYQLITNNDIKTGKTLKLGSTAFIPTTPSEARTSKKPSPSEEFTVEAGAEGHETSQYKAGIEEITDLECTINQIPKKKKDFPERLDLRKRPNLDDFIENDDPGSFPNSKRVKIKDGFIFTPDSLETFNEFVETYADSVNPDLTTPVNSNCFFDVNNENPRIKKVSIDGEEVDYQNGSLEIPTKPKIKLEFNENVKINGNLGLYDRNGNEIKTAKIINGDNFEITPASDLENSTDFYLFIDAEDLAGKKSEESRIALKTIPKPNEAPDYIEESLKDETVKEGTIWKKDLKKAFEDDYTSKDNLQFKANYDEIKIENGIASWSPTHDSSNLENVIFTATDEGNLKTNSETINLLFNKAHWVDGEITDLISNELLHNIILNFNRNGISVTDTTNTNGKYKVILDKNGLYKVKIRRLNKPEEISRIIWANVKKDTTYNWNIAPEDFDWKHVNETARSFNRTLQRMEQQPIWNIDLRPAYGSGKKVPDYAYEVLEEVIRNPNKLEYGTAGFVNHETAVIDTSDIKPFNTPNYVYIGFDDTIPGDGDVGHYTNSNTIESSVIFLRSHLSKERLAQAFLQEAMSATFFRNAPQSYSKEETCLHGKSNLEYPTTLDNKSAHIRYRKIGNYYNEECQDIDPKPLE